MPRNAKTKKPALTGKIIVRTIVAVIAVTAVVLLGRYGFKVLASNRAKTLFDELYGVYQASVYIEENAVASLNDPTSDFPSNYLERFRDLYAKNNDIVGWLTIEDAGVYFPVVQGDDNDYYKTRNYLGEQTGYGTPYLDSESSLEKSDVSTNKIIWLDGDTDGYITNELRKYLDISYYRKNPIIDFATVYEAGQWKVISAFVTSSLEEQGYVFNYYDYHTFLNEDELAFYIEHIRCRSAFDTRVNVAFGDELLTISAPASDFEGARLVLVARLVRDNEVELDEAQTASPNQFALQADEWYRIYGGQKPSAEQMLTAKQVMTTIIDSGGSDDSFMENPPPPYEEPPSEDTSSAEASSDESSEEPSSSEESSEDPSSSETSSEKTSSEDSSEETSSETSSEDTSSLQWPPSSSRPSSSSEDSSQIVIWPPVSNTSSEDSSQIVIWPPVSNTSSEDSSQTVIWPPVSNTSSEDSSVTSSDTSSDDASSNVTSSDVTSSDTTSSEPPPSTSGGLGDELLSVKKNGVTVTDTAYNIVCQIVANEMNSSSPDEAIKAQAVAAHTFVVFHNNMNWIPEVGLRTPNDRIKTLVKEVIEEMIYYNGKPIYAAYFSTSAGYTNTAQEVWGGTNYPYTQMVESKYDYLVPNYKVVKQYTYQYVRDVIKEELGISLTGDPTTWFNVVLKTNAGYNSLVSVGGQTTYTKSNGSTANITGTLLRSIFSLRSNHFDIVYNNDAGQVFEITTLGYGHGVGMSQYGAIQYANIEGWTYKQILTHYYTGVEVK